MKKYEFEIVHNIYSPNTIVFTEGNSLIDALWRTRQIFPNAFMVVPADPTIDLREEAI